VTSMRDFTILIQGPLNQVSLDNIKNYHNFGEVIVATDRGPEADMARIAVDARVKWALYDDPPKPPHLVGPLENSNFYRAINGIYHGLQKCETPYVIRTRSDECYHNLGPLLDLLLQDTKKMVCGNIFFKPWNKIPYHIGDHLYAAETLRLRKAFTRLHQTHNTQEVAPDEYDTENPFAAEQVLAYSFMRENGIEEANKEVFLEYFDVIDINELAPYQARWGWADRTYDESNLFSASRNDCVKKKEEI
jgi:hypothetical protein